MAPLDSESDTDRRDADRQMTIFRAGKIRHLERENLCLVRNISSTGAMAQIFQDLNVGDQVFLDIRLEDRIGAHVVWVRTTQVGLAFTKPIDLAEILSSELANGQRRRAPRITVYATGRLQVGEEFHRVAIDNVSQTGTCILCALTMIAGTEVRLWVDGLGPLPSFVQWTRNGIIGLAFARARSIVDLTTWVRELALADHSVP